MADTFDSNTRANVLLWDADGNPLVVSPNVAIPAGTKVLPIGGEDAAGVARFLQTETGGELKTVLHDSNGNPVAVIVDNTIYRLETRSTVVGQVQNAGVERKVTTIQDTEEMAEWRLQTESRIAPGSIVNIGTAIPSDPAALEIGFLTDDGLQTGSHDMLVDGSVTEVPFWYTPPAGVTVAIQTLLIVFTADDFEFDGASFGSLVALTNGFKVETDVGSVVTEIFNIKQNEDFLRVPGRLPLVNNTGPKDVLGVAFNFGGLIRLSQATGDRCVVTIRDDMTSVKLKYLTATLYGVEVT